MPDDELAHVLTSVGPRLRALRIARGLTLAQLGERTGISLSTLSRLESGHREPTLKLLLPLAKVYGVALDELVGAPATGDPRIHPRPFTRHGQTWIPLTHYLGGLHAYKQILPVRPAGARDRPAQGSHEGYEWLYVLSGRLLLALGDHDLVLTAGEAAEFDTRTPHGVANAGDLPVEWLALYGAQGERMHVRARPAATAVPGAAAAPGDPPAAPSHSSAAAPSAALLADAPPADAPLSAAPSSAAAPADAQAGPAGSNLPRSSPEAPRTGPGAGA